MSEQMKPIFSLDIGTRSVVGILLEADVENHYRLVGMEVEEHQERSMLDGQIHDVVAVASVIKRVKQRLESQFGPLDQVAVAAAGRSLITHKVQLDHVITGHPPMNEEEIRALELEAVQQAQKELATSRESEDRTEYYCVGYSVIKYLLDHSLIGNLVDQRGDTASVEIIATFLPRIVVDNLLASLKRADLTMSALTLEPIAAINVLIPSTMRRLNIALVDIGAGTSDIAITEGGTITAYGMVPIAGDEITDALMQAFLLDFPVAERVKRDLLKQENITFTDILGFEQQQARSEIVQNIMDEVSRLAATIADKIVELNGKAPQAVILIGGGSLTPNLGPTVAKILGIPEQRVAVRGVDAIPNLTNEQAQVSGPEMVTPIGIAVTAREHPVQYLSLKVNQKAYRFFDLRAMTVGDALIACGTDIKKLYGRPGLALTAKVNQRIKMFPGSHGTPPKIFVNKELVTIDTIVVDGDHIEVTAGTNGENAQVYVKDLMDVITTMDLTINGRPYSFSPIPMVNGKIVAWDHLLQERDEVEIHLPKNLFDLKDQIDLNTTLQQIITYTVNEEQKQHKLFETVLMIGTQQANLYTPLHPGDRITIDKTEYPLPTVGEVLPVNDLKGILIRVYFNGQEVHIPTTEMHIHLNGEPVSLDTNIHDGAVITYEHKPLANPIYSDVFRFIEYNLPAFTPGYHVVVLRNDEPTTLDQPIYDNDVLEIRNEPLSGTRI